MLFSLRLLFFCLSWKTSLSLWFYTRAVAVYRPGMFQGVSLLFQRNCVTLDFSWHDCNIVSCAECKWTRCRDFSWKLALHRIIMDTIYFLFFNCTKVAQWFIPWSSSQKGVFRCWTYISGHDPLNACLLNRLDCAFEFLGLFFTLDHFTDPM